MPTPRDSAFDSAPAAANPYAPLICPRCGSTEYANTVRWTLMSKVLMTIGVVLMGLGLVTLREFGFVSIAPGFFFMFYALAFRKGIRRCAACEYWW